MSEPHFPPSSTDIPSGRSPKKKRSLGKRLLRKMLVLFLLLIGAGVAGYFYVFDYLPAQDPSDMFVRSHIESILAGETRVFYRDGETQLGAYFDASHRVYVPFDSMPKHVINALVSAEDKRFWEHRGMDLRGFARAMFVNLRAGRIVQGGSSLSQQTAKNLFGREGRTLDQKWKELVNALRLEKRFSKKEILEFYLNQFYVSGTGRGLSIAAWHFFSKDLKDLTLKECAFIAGSVKGPARYDPFFAKTVQAREKALQRAEKRVDYVLGRMQEDEYINTAEYALARSQPLQFRQGQFRFSVSTILDRIEEKLSTPHYQKLFDSLGIDTWQKAQLSIVTTLDPQLQKAAEMSLQNALADLQLQLGGFSLPTNTHPDRVSQVREGEFLLGKVDSVMRKANQVRGLYLSFGQIKGYVSRSELDTLAQRMRSSADEILRTKLKAGQVLLVRILDSTRVYGAVPCRIETEPSVQGALLAIQHGEVLASWGGFHNTGYDRSFVAKRQFGSSWKPLLAALACRLGWRYSDPLDNDWDIFPYQGNIYRPSPDHKNKASRVSLAWMLARSENLAAVWLLEHLLDHLSLEEFMDVAWMNGYTQREDEDAQQWKIRLRDSLGLVFNMSARQEVEFFKAREALRQEWLQEGWVEKAQNLQNMDYGYTMRKELRQYRRQKNREQLEFNYLYWNEQIQNRLAAAAQGDSLSDPDSLTVWKNLTFRDMMRLASMVQIPDPEADLLLQDSTLFRWPEFRRSLAMAEFRRFVRELGMRSPLAAVQSMPLGVNDVSLAEMVQAYQTILSGKITRCRDGLWGEPCLIREIRNRYGTIIFQNQVETRPFLHDSVTAQVALMLREVFESGTARRALEEIALPIPQDTSGKAYALFPVVGKTGTTNSYRNVAFMGGVPDWDSIQGRFDFYHPLTVGAYAGFDDNRAMRSKGLRVAGATGALPPWADFVREYLHFKHYEQRLLAMDAFALEEGEVTWWLPGRSALHIVDAASGLAPEPGLGEIQTTSMPWLDFIDLSHPDANLVQSSMDFSSLDSVKDSVWVDTIVEGPDQIEDQPEVPLAEIH